MMLYVFNCWAVEKAPLFQTGWFVESLLTQTLIIHVIRTNKIPFIQSRASWPLIATTAVIMSIGVLAADDAVGILFGLHRTSAAVLATSRFDFAQLYGPYASCQNMARAAELDIVVAVPFAADTDRP